VLSVLQRIVMIVKLNLMMKQLKK